ncbi:LOW QUALITY PROTEIN: conserved hypothetical protein, partial [Neisseria gonorrhoeae PID332]
WINKNQDKAAKPQTVQIVRQGEVTPYRFLLIHYIYPDQRRIFRPPPLPAGVYQRTERQAARRAVQPKPRRQ